MADENVIPTPTPAVEPQTFSREYVAELRQESASYRTARNASDVTAAAATEAAKKATEEADAKVAAATTAADARILRAELKAEALKAGMVDLDGLKLADMSKVKLNEAGEVEGAEALMTELKKSKPYLFGVVSSSSNPGGQPPKPSGNKAKSATEMTTEEYKAARMNIRRGIVPSVTA